jgi:hypothetical protein
VSQYADRDPFDDGPRRTSSVRTSEVSSLSAWLMAGLSLVAVGVAIVGLLFPTVLGLDLVALWPLPAIALLLALATHLAKARGVLRVVAPLLLVTWLILGVGWWWVGIPPSPSQAANIIGPPQVPSEVAIGISLDGELTIGLDTTNVYSIRVGSRGGTTGAPDVLEARHDDRMAMTVQERSDSGWYRTSGWDVTLHSASLWRIEATATTVDLDLAWIPLRQLGVTAESGTITLGDPVALVTIDLQGAFEVSVLAGTPVQVVGVAEVPVGWATSATGSSSPTPGDGFLITTSGGQGIRIVER